MSPFGFSPIKTVLILGPHPDDGEFSSAGTIQRFLENGLNVYYAVFSMCEKSVPKGFPPDAIRKELFIACKELGIPEENIITYDFEVRCFPQFRQEILEELTALNRKIKPDLVLLPSSNDIHQDHQTIYEEGIRAFKNINVLGYEMPWNNLRFHSSMYVRLEERHVQKKIEVLNQYKTQQFRHYSNEDFVLSLAKLRGIQTKEAYAEAFEVIRWKIL